MKVTNKVVLSIIIMNSVLAYGMEQSREVTGKSDATLAEQLRSIRGTPDLKQASSVDMSVELGKRAGRKCKTCLGMTMHAAQAAYGAISGYLRQFKHDLRRD